MDDVLVPSSRDPSHGPLSINSITVHITVGLEEWAPALNSESIFFRSTVTEHQLAALLWLATIGDLHQFSQLVTFGGAGATLFKVNPNSPRNRALIVLHWPAQPKGGSTQAFDWTWANGPDANLADQLHLPLARASSLLTTPHRVFRRVGLIMQRSPAPRFPSPPLWQCWARA